MLVELEQKDQELATLRKELGKLQMDLDKEREKTAESETINDRLRSVQEKLKQENDLLLENLAALQKDLESKLTAANTKAENAERMLRECVTKVARAENKRWNEFIPRVENDQRLNDIMHKVIDSDPVLSGTRENELLRKIEEINKSSNEKELKSMQEIERLEKENKVENWFTAVATEAISRPGGEYAISHYPLDRSRYGRSHVLGISIEMDDAQYDTLLRRTLDKVHQPNAAMENYRWIIDNGKDARHDELDLKFFVKRNDEGSRRWVFYRKPSDGRKTVFAGRAGKEFGELESPSKRPWCDYADGLLLEDPGSPTKKKRVGFLSARESN